MEEINRKERGNGRDIIIKKRGGMGEMR